MGREDFFSQYLSYSSGTEVPSRYNRWSCIAMIGAYLGRSYSLKHGLFNLYPNIYCMLIGNPGARKSTPIKAARQILLKAGYNTIAADKTTKEKYLMDLAKSEDGPESDILTKNLFGNEGAVPSESFIMADEFNDFFGNNNLEFISLLGTLWDYNGEYKSRIKNGTSLCIPDPTISILGGNTPTSFNSAFPAEVIGQGFFSRLLLIYGESNGKKIAFPVSPTDAATGEIILALQRIRNSSSGTASISTVSLALLEKIYHNWAGVEDVRFTYYSQRRFSHLLKLCLIHSAARWSREISESDIIYANTVLDAAEKLMPKALGEFGKAKNSDISQKIIGVLDTAAAPISLKDLWKYVQNDLEKLADLSHMLQSLQMAEKIQFISPANGTAGGFLSKRVLASPVYNDVIDSSLLTGEERGEA